MSTLSLTRSLTGLLLGVVVSFTVQAEGGSCPNGYYPIGGQGTMGCAPLPNGAQRAVPQRPAEVWQDRYGAIYLDLPKGAMGTSTSLASRAASEQAAIADCKARGGIDCKQEASYGNGCIAFVIDDNWHGAVFRKNLDAAKQQAMRDCQGVAGNANCHVYYTDCSQPVRIQ
ncbi:DUF4189 domain-containing protein [Variovorax sp. J22G21]|uniref:DUF4189 domain-containing protein n=1 Tax=Variovorax fucosicus TaxID=3053517 RepID=UPI0025775ADE|nr:MULTISPECIES: DUF4189 domain-containing protein [unclassified Variovorax]MDM0038259.1 DUF4189 domain-containing protein [Variovorax sp. J22R193]MDM0063035.1 DUF4189 domain-containing protein [Variovorax sp. J22G21]